MVLMCVSSAGNTRGLIEARRCSPWRRLSWRLPRGIPAASLKLLRQRRGVERIVGLPRGIPAASLKHTLDSGSSARKGVFRGEYPRPH